MQPSLKTRDLLTLPPVDRPRPERATRIGRREIAGFLLSAVWVLAVVLVALWLVHMVTTRPVPNVVGVEQSLAVTRLAQLGYSSKVVAVQFGDEMPGTVLTQSPRGGSRGTDDTVVELVIAAGTNAGTVPELVGQTQMYSELVLRQMGLSVMVVELIADEPQGQVLSIKPDSGAPISPGDSVTLIVSSYQETLAPIAFPLAGRKVAIEPRWADTGSVDGSYEVALRLASLIEASGGRPSITRTSTEKSVSDAEYDRRRRNSGADIFVRIGYRDTGDGGVWVLSPPAASPEEPNTLGDLIAENFKLGAIMFDHRDQDGSLPATGDAVGIVLGVPGDELDASHFADAEWRDLVARAVYLAVGKWVGR